MKNTVHENLLLKTAVVINDSSIVNDVLEIGREIVEAGFDEICQGGFWIWDMNAPIEFYSPKFRQTLGFEGEHDFPSAPESWQKQINPEDLKVASMNYERHLSNGHPYNQVVTYRKKTKGTITLLCSGTVIRDKKGKPRFFVGTHKLSLD